MRIRLSDLSQFSRDLSGLLQLGYPTVEALQKVKPTQSASLAPILERSVDELQKGRSLTEAFKAEQDLLPLFVRLVESAESSEALPEGLERAAEVIDELAERRNRCFLATLYPAIVFTMILLIMWSVCVAGGSLFGNLFESMSISLPLPTQVLIVVSNFGQHPLGILLFFGGLAAMWYLVLGSSGGPSALIFRLPLFGSWLLRQEAVLYLKTVGHLMELGAPLTEAAGLSVESCSGSLRAKLSTIPSRLEAGDKFSRALRDTELIPELGLWALERREETESLRLLEIGELLDRELDLSLNRGLVVFEPLIFLGVVFAILFFFLAVFLPLYQLIGNLG